MIPVWLCADDYGIAPGVNAAILDLIARGRLNATSVMVVAPAFDGAAVTALKTLRDDNRAAIGLHVTLTAPFRPLSEGYRPLRHDMFLPLGATLGTASARRLDPASLAREAAAQLDAFREAFGRPPDFVDGHQHVQLFPQIRDAVIDAVARHAPNAWIRQCGRAGPRRARLADRKGLLLDILSVGFRRRAASHGLAVNPAFAGTYDFAPNAEVATIFPRFFQHLPADGLVMCHPGTVDETLRSLDPLTTLREREYAYLGGEAFPKMLRERGYTLERAIS